MIQFNKNLTLNNRIDNKKNKRYKKSQASGSKKIHAELNIE
jgi:hypothetical protein